MGRHQVGAIAIAAEAARIGDRQIDHGGGIGAGAGCRGDFEGRTQGLDRCPQMVLRRVRLADILADEGGTDCRIEVSETIIVSGQRCQRQGRTQQRDGIGISPRGAFLSRGLKEFCRFQPQSLQFYRTMWNFRAPWYALVNSLFDR